jgi:hypothetical protein
MEREVTDCPSVSPRHVAIRDVDVSVQGDTATTTLSSHRGMTLRREGQRLVEGTTLGIAGGELSSSLVIRSVNVAELYRLA